MNIELEMPSYEIAQITDLSVALEPVQENDYDSVWPAGGGKNKVNPNDLTPGWIYGGTGAIYPQGSIQLEYTSDFIEIPSGTTYVTCGYDNYGTNISDRWASVGLYDENKDFVVRQNGTWVSSTSGLATYNISNNTTAKYVRFCTRTYGHGTEYIYGAFGQYSAFSPYSNICPITGHSEVKVYNGAVYGTADDTYTISLGGTYYGGTLDVLTGVLTVEWENIDSYAGETLPGEWISDRDVYASGTTPTTGAQVVYKLATPTTVQLTAHEVETLTGINNVWSDSGDVTVTISGTTQTGDVVTVTALPQHKIQLFMP